MKIRKIIYLACKIPHIPSLKSSRYTKAVLKADTQRMILKQIHRGDPKTDIQRLPCKQILIGCPESN